MSALGIRLSWILHHRSLVAYKAMVIVEMLPSHSESLALTVNSDVSH